MSSAPADPSDAMEKWEVQLRKGCLELAILASLWSGKRYGLEILRHLEEKSGLIVPEATVYPLLTRLKTTGLVDSEWVDGTAGHPRKYYRLTAGGRRRALEMARFWSRFSKSLERLLAPLRKEQSYGQHGPAKTERLPEGTARKLTQRLWSPGAGNH
jgi:PadR family transcriptional regulator PadR